MSKSKVGHSITRDIIQQIKLSLRQCELLVILSGDRINLLSWAAGIVKNIKLTIGVYNGMLVFILKRLRIIKTSRVSLEVTVH